MAHEPTMIDAEMHDVIKTLVSQQLEVLSAGSELARQRKHVGELKKLRDGTIAEVARLQIKATNMPLPLGLKIDDRGFPVAEDDEDEGEGDE